MTQYLPLLLWIVGFGAVGAFVVIIAILDERLWVAEQRKRDGEDIR